MQAFARLPDMANMVPRSAADDAFLPASPAIYPLSLVARARLTRTTSSPPPR